VLIQAFRRGGCYRYLAATDRGEDGFYWHLEWGGPAGLLAVSNATAEECDERFLFVVKLLLEPPDKLVEPWTVAMSPFYTMIETLKDVERYRIIDLNGSNP